MSLALTLRALAQLVFGHKKLYVGEGMDSPFNISSTTEIRDYFQCADLVIFSGGKESSTATICLKTLEKFEN